ncbi:MAG: hypothetical protein KAS32_08130 [Candidatus Peribacteraceae bacterium]|nr:hypothetical protein [Candidatus Peribacteraceae bacterium]
MPIYIDWTEGDMPTQNFIEIIENSDLSTVGNSNEEQKDICKSMATILKKHFKI